MIWQQKHFFWLILATILYYLWFGLAVGLRPDHFLMYFTALLLFSYSENSKQLFYGFSPFMFLGILYDSMRIWPNHSMHSVYISELYLLDKSLFGLNTDAGCLTLNEFFATHTNTFLDISTALFYLGWIPLPMAFAAYLWRKDRHLFFRFSYAYLLTNLIGFSLYYFFPAAPPWYIEKNGFQFIANPVRSAAGLLSFDEFFHIHFFKNLYERNANVYAAIPSLHSAYPFISLLYALQVPKKWPGLVFLTLSLGIWFSAIYLQHHYVIDVILGALVALIAYLLLEFYLIKTVLARQLQWLLKRTKIENGAEE